MGMVSYYFYTADIIFRSICGITLLKSQDFVNMGNSTNTCFAHDTSASHMFCTRHHSRIWHAACVIIVIIMIIKIILQMYCHTCVTFHAKKKG